MATDSQKIAVYVPQDMLDAWVKYANEHGFSINWATLRGISEFIRQSVCEKVGYTVSRKVDSDAFTDIIRRNRKATASWAKKKRFVLSVCDRCGGASVDSNGRILKSTDSRDDESPEVYRLRKLDAVCCCEKVESTDSCSPTSSMPTDSCEKPAAEAAMWQPSKPALTPPPEPPDPDPLWRAPKPIKHRWDEVIPFKRTDDFETEGGEPVDTSWMHPKIEDWTPESVNYQRKPYKIGRVEWKLVTGPIDCGTDESDFERLKPSDPPIDLDIENNHNDWLTYVDTEDWKRAEIVYRKMCRSAGRVPNGRYDIKGRPETTDDWWRDHWEQFMTARVKYPDPDDRNLPPVELDE